jgi:hypothetical protein
MGLQSVDNSLRNWRLGLFDVPDPDLPVFINLVDDLGNPLVDDEGRNLVVPN